jgi:hypothetical protein
MSLRAPLILVAVVACVLAGSARRAHASQLIDRNAAHVVLSVNARHEAMVTYRVGATVKHVLAWGAVNAARSSLGGTQVRLKLDYTGGWGKYRNAGYWASFRGDCLPYDGPPLAWTVTACKARDGSYWALQAWRRELPNYGLAATAAQAVLELRLSHWTTALPQLSIRTDWAYHRYDHLFGTYTYGGMPVHGFKSTRRGVPLDAFGRNIYVDTLDSTYGSGWRRENSFLTHEKGSFCYGFYPHGSHPIGAGRAYRATAEGPGVTPDVMWQGVAPGPYDVSLDATENRMLAGLADPVCKPN